MLILNRCGTGRNEIHEINKPKLKTGKERERGEEKKRAVCSYNPLNSAKMTVYHFQEKNRPKD